jgi:hypothetical protein
MDINEQFGASSADLSAEPFTDNRCGKDLFEYKLIADAQSNADINES